VIDLGGHTLLGSSRPELDQPGINTNGHSGVVVRNGAVTHFAAGVAVNGGATNTLDGLLIQDNIGSLRGEHDYGDGIVLMSSNRNRITNNRIVHNGTYNGLGLVNSNDNLVANNILLQNDVAELNNQSQPTRQRDFGLWVLSLAPGLTADRNVIRGNQVLRSGSDGIRIAAFTFDNLVDRNISAQNGLGVTPVFGDGDGIAVFGIRTTVVGNTTVSNGDDGIAVVRLLGGNGLLTGQNNTIQFNASRRNDVGPKPSVGYDLSDTNPDCDANAWASNSYLTINQPCVAAHP
jgi:parallel beta-helix repeat protein